MLRAIAIVLAVLVSIVAVLAGLLLANANWLRKPISNYVSSKLERRFEINGDLRIGLFLHPHIEVNDVVLGNAQWGTRADMLRLKRGVVSVELLPLLHKRFVLPEVRLTGADVWLERAEDGRANWTFGSQEQERSGPANTPEIDGLWIEQGKLAFVDPKVRTNIAVEVDSAPGAAGDQSILRFAGKGSLRDEAFKLDGSAGSLLELTEAGKPYKLDVRMIAGSTKASFAGTLVPLKMESIDGDIALSGKDLSKLYPMIPVPLPWTPPYSIAGHLKRNGMKYSLSGLRGKVGSSDVNGVVDVDLTNQRPRLKMDIVSERLDYKDLLGLLGSPPPGKGQVRPQEQRRTAQRLAGEGKVLSPKPYSLERLRVVDADVKFKGKSIIARDIPLDKVAFDLALDKGRLTLDPLEFGLAKGRVTAKITLDASQDLIRTQGDATARNLEVKELMPSLKDSKGSAGKLGGRMKLATKGNSIAQMAASANGEADLVMGEGKLSTIALVLTNLDLANATKYILRGNPDAPVYCAVIQTSVRDGIMQPNLFVVDSSEENIRGDGSVNFKDEAYDLQLKAKSKRASLLALRGPIHIGGTFRNPKVMPEIAPLAARAGAAVALGALLTPIAALAALVDVGGAKDSNCGALIAQAKQETAATPVTPPAKADASKAAPQDKTPESRRPAHP